jgi:hypothetical protein
MQFGQLCSNCTNSRCVDEPSAAEPLWIPNDDGTREKLEGCPRKLLTPGTFQLLKLVRFADKGNLPNGKGPLDETQWFIDACSFVWSEQSAWRAKLGALPED